MQRHYTHMLYHQVTSKVSYAFGCSIFQTYYMMHCVDQGWATPFFLVGHTDIDKVHKELRIRPFITTSSLGRFQTDLCCTFTVF